MPSYIGLDTPIFGISIVPTCVSASAARGSAGALSGFGNVAGTVVVVEGTGYEDLQKGPGHYPGTALPGQVGNVVVAGHRTSHSKPFRNIDKLVPGDDVIMTTADGRFDYKVTGTEIVYPDALWIVNQTPDYTATLFACHPAGSTRQRIVVHLALDPNG